MLRTKGNNISMAICLISLGILFAALAQPTKVYYKPTGGNSFALDGPGLGEDPVPGTRGVEFFPVGWFDLYYDRGFEDIASFGNNCATYGLNTNWRLFPYFPAGIWDDDGSTRLPTIGPPGICEIALGRAQANGIKMIIGMPDFMVGEFERIGSPRYFSVVRPERTLCELWGKGYRWNYPGPYMLIAGTYTCSDIETDDWYFPNCNRVIDINDDDYSGMSPEDWKTYNARIANYQPGLSSVPGMGELNWVCRFDFRDKLDGDGDGDKDEPIHYPSMGDLSMDEWTGNLYFTDTELESDYKIIRGFTDDPDEVGLKFDIPYPPPEGQPVDIRYDIPTELVGEEIPLEQCYFEYSYEAILDTIMNLFPHLDEPACRGQLHGIWYARRESRISFMLRKLDIEAPGEEPLEVSVRIRVFDPSIPGPIGSGFADFDIVMTTEDIGPDVILDGNKLRIPLRSIWPFIYTRSDRSSSVDPEEDYGFGVQLDSNTVTTDLMDGDWQMLHLDMRDLVESHPDWFQIDLSPTPAASEGDPPYYYKFVSFKITGRAFDIARVALYEDRAENVIEGYWADNLNDDDITNDSQNPDERICGMRQIVEKNDNHTALIGYMLEGEPEYDSYRFNLAYANDPIGKNSSVQMSHRLYMAFHELLDEVGAPGANHFTIAPNSRSTWNGNFPSECIDYEFMLGLQYP